MVIVNNDEQAVLKKGKPFMSIDERVKIIEEFKCVDYVIKSIDTNRTVCKTLETVEPKPHFFVMEETKIIILFRKDLYVKNEV